MSHLVIATSAAPSAIGPYSQAIKAGNTLYCSGQIGLDPATGQLVEGFSAQVHQAFKNLTAVIQSGGSSIQQVTKFTLFLTDLSLFSQANEIMQQYVVAPYPARSTVGVASLPRGALFEVEAIVVLA
jgi:2-iminobutanoate/2-iminopropanoate deaminase